MTRFCNFIEGMVVRLEEELSATELHSCKTVQIMQCKPRKKIQATPRGFQIQTQVTYHNPVWVQMQFICRTNYLSFKWKASRNATEEIMPLAMILTRRVCWVSVLAPRIQSRAVSLLTAALPLSPNTSCLTHAQHWGFTPEEPHFNPFRFLRSKTPPFPRPVAHAGPELHLLAAQGPLPLCLVSTLRFSSHSRQDQMDCALSPEVTVGSQLGPKTFSECLSETPQATRWA